MRECMTLNSTYRLHKLHILLLLFDHGLKIDVYFDAQGLICGLALTPHLFDVVHPLASLLSVDFQLFNLVQAG